MWAGHSTSPQLCTRPISAWDSFIGIYEVLPTSTERLPTSALWDLSWSTVLQYGTQLSRRTSTALSKIRGRPLAGPVGSTGWPASPPSSRSWDGVSWRTIGGTNVWTLYIRHFTGWSLYHQTRSVYHEPADQHVAQETRTTYSVHEPVISIPHSGTLFHSAPYQSGTTYPLQ